MTLHLNLYVPYICWTYYVLCSSFISTITDHRKNELSNEFEFYGDLRVVSAPRRLNCSSEFKLNNSQEYKLDNALRRIGISV